jgi:glycosidase
MKHYSNGPRRREFLLTVGELPNTLLESNVMTYVSASQSQLNMVFNFGVVSLGQTHGNRLVPVPFSTSEVKRQLSRWQTFVNAADAWTTIFLENHGQRRSVSRFGSDSEYYRKRSGKMLKIGKHVRNVVFVSRTGNRGGKRVEELGRGRV